MRPAAAPWAWLLLHGEGAGFLLCGRASVIPPGYTETKQIGGPSLSRFPLCSEVEIRRDMKAIISRAKYSLEAGHGAEALRLLRSNNICPATLNWSELPVLKAMTLDPEGWMKYAVSSAETKKLQIVKQLAQGGFDAREKSIDAAMARIAFDLIGVGCVASSVWAAPWTDFVLFVAGVNIGVFGHVAAASRCREWESRENASEYVARHVEISMKE